MKILHQEKTSQLPYPMGIVQTEWPLIRYLKGIESPVSSGKEDPNENEKMYDNDGFFGRGESWKHLRAFLQTDLLSPQSSRRYIPGLVQAAKVASEVAPASRDSMNQYFNRCAFDMFNSVMFGEMTKTANLSLASQDNVEFCNHAVEGLGKMIYQMSNPYEQVVGFRFGIETSSYKDMCSAFENVFVTAESKYAAFRERYENDYDSLTDLEKDSFILGTCN